MHEERDCLIGLAPKYDAKETARQAAIEALKQRRFLDADDCCKVYRILCSGLDTPDTPAFKVLWGYGTGSLTFSSRKNAERFAAHCGGIVVSNL